MPGLTAADIEHMLLAIVSVVGALTTAIIKIWSMVNETRSTVAVNRERITRIECQACAHREVVAPFRAPEPSGSGWLEGDPVVEPQPPTQR